MNPSVMVLVWLTVAIGAGGCAIWFLVSGQVPLVVLFTAVGEVTRQDDPRLYWHSFYPTSC